VTVEEYNSFYRSLTGAYDDPAFRVHFRADSPIDLKVLLFVPSFHTEKWGGGHMAPGVSLYSRKVLIEKDAPDLLPEWMRFVKVNCFPLSFTAGSRQGATVTVTVPHFFSSFLRG